MRVLRWPTSSVSRYGVHKSPRPNERSRGHSHSKTEASGGLVTEVSHESGWLKVENGTRSWLIGIRAAPSSDKSAPSFQFVHTQLSGGGRRHPLKTFPRTCVLRYSPVHVSRRGGVYSLIFSRIVAEQECFPPVEGISGPGDAQQVVDENG